MIKWLREEKGGASLSADFKVKPGLLIHKARWKCGMNVMFDGMKQLGGIEFRKGKLKNPALII